MDLAAEAKTFAAEHGLDGSLASLPAFEAILQRTKKTDRTRDAIMRWGAYLGEAMRAESKGAMTWVADEVDGWALAGPKATWFPISKIVKFLANGSKDSPSAFASVAVEMLLPPKAKKARTEATQEEKKHVAAFLKKPSVEALVDAERALYQHERETEIIASFSVSAQAFFPFLGMKKIGKTRFATNPGWLARDAAFIVLRCTPDADSEKELAALLASKDTLVRENAAFVVARLAIERNELARAVDVMRGRDAAVRTGTIAALDWHVCAIVGQLDDRGDIGDPSRFAPIIRAALAGKTDERMRAVMVVFRLAKRLHADISSMLPDLLDVIAKGKPQEVEYAMDALAGQLWNIKHGRAPFMKDVIRAIDHVIAHSRALPGKVKVTKVQRASRWCLETFKDAIPEHLSAADRKRVEDAHAKILKAIY